MNKIFIIQVLFFLFVSGCVSMRDTMYKSGSVKPAAEATESTASTPAGARGRIVETAKKQLDKYYAYGKQGEYEGFDCSALAQYAYNEAGIKIPRTVKRQYGSARKISKEELKAGDLVFFTTYAPGATHVGIYIGDGKFIHSPTTGKKVDISELSNVYWYKAFISGGSFIND